MTEPSSEFVGVACGLLFEGNVLTYDPASNGMEWVPVWGTVNDLSSMQDSSAWEFSNITLPDSLMTYLGWIDLGSTAGGLCPLLWHPVPELPLMMMR